MNGHSFGDNVFTRVGVKPLIRACSILGLLGLLACGQSPVPDTAPGAPTELASPAPDEKPTPTLAETLSQIQKAVVQIKTPAGTGSGFLFDTKGLILTNAHVVGQFPRVTVLAEGLGVIDRLGITADVVGVDEASDLAVVSVETGGDFPVLTLGDSETVALGEEVMAIGYALGEDLVVTRGIVSSRRRFGNTTLIQTDAALNRGNSGGPLVNRRGEVIGVNTAVFRGELVGTVEGVGLAIPTNHVKGLLSSLKAGGAVAGAFTGTFHDSTRDVDAEMSLTVTQTGAELKGTVEILAPLDRRGSIEGNVTGDEVEFVVTYLSSGLLRTMTFQGRLQSRGVLRGTYTLAPTGEQGRWEVSRKDSP